MPMMPSAATLRRSLLLVVLALTLGLPSWAQKVKEGKDALDQLAFANPETWIAYQGETVATPSASGLSNAAVETFGAFQADTGSVWRLVVDRVTGKPSLVEGGTPWIPGTGLGNSLRASEFGATETQASSNALPVEVVASRARQFLQAYPALFGVDPADLKVMEGASGPALDYLYYVDFQWHYKGLPVENAHLVFRLNSGNLVQFGQENICDTVRELDPNPDFDSRTAWDLLWGYVGGQRPGDAIVDSGRLLVQPLSTPEALSGLAYPPGRGLTYRLVYALAFRRPGVLGTWEARVDAHTGEILSFRDENDYGHIQGGVYLTDKNPTQTEVTMPFPFADYGASSFADLAGNFGGTTGTCTMTGRTGSSGNVGGVDIVDTSCGAISRAADAQGLIDFGASAGTDCTTPGVGGAGNTHAARTQYYNVSQIKIKAFTYLPTNTWLQGRVTDNVNLKMTCNAYWDGAALNFFWKGTGSCGNTGELPGVSLHEWGHGMDSNDGSSGGDSGTGEIYGDTTAFLQTHQSCLGGGFTSSNCSGYGDACLQCTGVREADYMRHHVHAPATPTGFNMVQCPASTCQGPCTKECHCEAAPGIQANWDLVNRDLVAAPYNLDLATAWQYLDRFWYASRATASRAFVCGVNTSNAVGNLFQVYRVVDDCDGNLANGTPHTAAIWAAMSRHEIADSAAVQTDGACGCASVGTPVLDGVNGSASNTLAWSAAAGAVSYDLFRNETGCSAGFTKIADTAATTYADTSVTAGVTSYYRVQGKGSGSCPPGPMSECLALLPSSCTTPGTPAGTSAVATADNQITVAWAAGSPAAESYDLYRAEGDCPSVAFTLLQTGLSASPWVDGTVSGGTTYSYRVVGRLGACRSYQSACDSATATGPCTFAPEFAGLTALSNPAGATCGLTLTWAAGTVRCAGPLTYRVYRATTSPFTPAPSNRIASGLTGTTYTDTDSLVYGTTYYYIVRAYDGTSAAEDSNTTSLFGTPGPIQNVTGFSDDFETGTGLGQWTASCVTQPCENLQEVKGIQACTPTQSGAKIFRWGGATNPTSCTANYASAQNSLFEKLVTIPPFATNVRLSFWHRWRFGTGDGAFLRVSQDGVNLYYIPPSFIGSYPLNPPNTAITYGGASRMMWAGTQTTMIQSVLNLDVACQATFGLSAAAAAAGNATAPGQIYIAFNGYSNDSSTNSYGWFVDDVQVTYDMPTTCTTATPGPPAVPSGAAGKSAMTAAKGASDGSTLQLSWDTSCRAGSDRYKLLYGYASQLPASYDGTYGLTGSVCTDGGSPITASPLTWTSVPPVEPASPNFLWWVLIESDSAGNSEGSWGTNSGPNERTGPGTAGSSGQCGTTTKVLGNSCGQ